MDKLTTLTETQKKVRAKTSEDGGLPLINRGRVVLITHLQDDRKLHQLVKEFQELLAMKNKEASISSDPNTIPINQVYLEIVHCYPASIQCLITPCETRIDETPLFSYQVFTVEAGQGLAKKLLFMALCHYQLASTTGKIFFLPFLCISALKPNYYYIFFSDWHPNEGRTECFVFC